MCCYKDLDFCWGPLHSRKTVVSWQWQSEKYIQYSETVYAFVCVESCFISFLILKFTVFLWHRAEQAAKCDIWIRKSHFYQTYINLAMFNLIFRFKSEPWRLVCLERKKIMVNSTPSPLSVWLLLCVKILKSGYYFPFIYCEMLHFPPYTKYISKN